MFYLLRYLHNASKNDIFTGYNGRWGNNGSTPAAGTVYNIVSEITSTGRNLFTVDNVLRREYDYSANGPVNTGCNLYLFARNKDGVADSFVSGRCYGLEISQVPDGGTDYVPICNFTPCEKDGRAALYDSVSGMVFFGRGADLIAPPDLGATPDAFVDYVVSDGTQYIDTEVIGRSGTKAEFDVWWNDLPVKSSSGGGLVFLGARGSDGYFCLYRQAAWNNNSSSVSESFYTFYKGRYQGITGAQGTFTTGKKYSITTEITEAGIHNATIDGTPYSKDYSIGTSNGSAVGPFNSGTNLFLFALNDKGAPSSYSSVRCYGLKIEQTDSNGVYQLVRDFKPCIKDGVAALYDDVSKKIYYPKVGKLRAVDETAPAKFVEYVESDGSQYVDTGIKGKAGTKAEMTFNANEDNGNPSYLLSSYGNSVNMNFCYFGNSLNVGFGGSTWNAYWSYLKGTQYALRSEYTLSQKVNAIFNNNASTEKTATGGTDSGVNLFAFARNNAGTADGKCSVKLYDMKIWQADDGGTYSLVRDFRPCVATNGVAALYDTVSGVIFYPQGGLLATGGVERAVAVTAQWKGGAVTAEVDLSVAANWDCFDAAGNLVEGATPTAVTTVLVGQGSPLLALPTGVAVQDWAGVMLTNSVTLGAAGDWSPLGVMTLANDVTVDLNGNDLVSGGFTLASGETASVANSGAAATLTFAIADGNTATMDNITFANNIAFAKTGVGTLSCSGISVGARTTGSFTLSDGTFSIKGGLIVGDNGNGVGTITQTGGTLDVDGWYLTMGYLYGAYGTYTMTGGQLFVRTHQIIVGQTGTAAEPSTFDLSGTGVATFMGGVAMSVHDNGGTSVLSVHDGGRIRTSSITKGASENAQPTVSFDGGILEPLGDVTGLLEGMPLTVGSKGFIVDTAGHNVSFGDFTLTGGGELIKTGAGTLTIANSPWSAIAVSNGTLAVAAPSDTLASVYVAKGAVLDLGGNTVTCGAISGEGTVMNGTLIVTGTLSVAVGKRLTFTGAALNVSGARVMITTPESITGRDPIVVATSNQSITGHARTTVSGRRAQISQDGDVYKLELVPSGGFHVYIR